MQPILFASAAIVQAVLTMPTPILSVHRINIGWPFAILLSRSRQHKCRRQADDSTDYRATDQEFRFPVFFVPDNLPLVSPFKKISD